MRSLKSQLLCAVSLVTIVLLCLSQFTVYSLIRSQLYAEFDYGLQEKARVLALMIDQDAEFVDVDFRNQTIPEFTRSDRPEYYQLWHENGQVLDRSRHVKDASLPRQTLAEGKLKCYPLTLPDGRPGRAVSYRFRPAQDCHGRPFDFAPSSRHATERSKVTTAASQVTVTLVVARDTLEIEASLAAIRWIVFGACLITVVLAVAILAWLVTRSLRPLQAISRQMASVDAQNLKQRFEMPGAPAEIQPIVVRLNELVVRLEAAFARERTFSADIAHELRTPLAGIRTTLELALHKQRDSLSYRNTIERCLRISGEMESVVATLLALGLPNSKFPTENLELVPIDSFLRDCWRPYEQRATQRRVSVWWEGSECRNDCAAAAEDAISVYVDRGRLAVVVSNLLDNAVSYVNRGGAISISWSLRDEQLAVRVTNSGCQLLPDQVPHIFEYFWRADTARSATGRHAGLGLALAHRVADAMDGKLEANVEQDRFSIALSVPIQSPQPTGCIAAC